jgi:hypothetical protein
MGMRRLLAAFFAAVVMMAWGYYFWDLSPFPSKVQMPLPRQGDTVKRFLETFHRTGVYIYPLPEANVTGEERKEAQQEYLEKMRQGPVIEVNYHNQGVDPMGRQFLGSGFLQYFVSAWLAAWLLSLAAPSLPNFSARVGFVFVAGLFAVVAIKLGDGIWLSHSWDWVLLEAGFQVSLWLLAGLAIAVIVKAPRTSAYHAYS